MPDIRTPFEGGTIPPAGGTPQMAGRTSSEKILADIKRLRLRTIKRTAIALLVIIIGALVGMSWRQAFESGALTPGALAATVAFVAFMPFAGLTLKWYATAIANAIAAFFMVAPFLDSAPISTALLIWGIVAVIFVLAGFSAMWRAGAFLHFKMNALGGSMGLLVIGFSVLFTGLHYGTALAPRDAVSPQLFISEQSISDMLRVSQGAVQRFIPEFRATMTMGEYVDAMIAMRSEAVLAELQNDPRYQLLPLAEKQRMERETLAQLRERNLKELFDAINKPVNAQQSISSFFFEYIEARFFSLPAATQQGFVFGWLAIVFFTVWSAGTLVKPVIVAISWILLQLMLGIRLFEIARESTERKYLSIA